jgi:hypothetical protein
VGFAGVLEKLVECLLPGRAVVLDLGKQARKC